ncbi:MAG: hypothetical protein JW818_17020 [Pirellulales bacterium]|nr:hypothetical protein [Pirellulales bacterium]
MSPRKESSQVRILELLADEAVFGLGASQERELQRLLRAVPGFDRDCMQRVATTVLLAGVEDRLQSLPPALAHSIAVGERPPRNQHTSPLSPSSAELSEP